MIRHLKGKTSGELKLSTLYGREHLVIPVIALVEGVIRPMGSIHGELALASEFGKTPEGWNGRPVVLGHPSEGDQRISANSPKALEESGLGSIFATCLKDGKKLFMEAWIDLERVPKVAEAEALVAAVRAGEMAEVSVGVFISEEKTNGTHNGEAYGSVWRDVVPDHLALLQRGTLGACSNEMGCGAPRAAQKKEEPVAKTWKEKFAEASTQFTSMIKTAKSPEGESVSDLQRSLDQALFGSVPGYLGLVDVFPDNTMAVYAAAPDGDLKYFQATYSLNEKSEVSLGKDHQEVEMTTKYEPVVASRAAEGCGCGGNSSESPAKPEGDGSMDKKTRVAAVVARLAAKSDLFKLEDAVLLEGASDERIAQLEARAAELEKPAAPAPAPAPVVAAAAVPEKQKTEAELLESMPETKAIVDSFKAAQAAEKNGLVTKLKAAQTTYSEEKLNTMGIGDLKALDMLIGSLMPKRDFSGLPTPRAAAAVDDENNIPEAPSMDDFLGKKSA